MVKANELVATGLASPYQSNKPTVYCYKSVGEKAKIPCVYRKRLNTYPLVEFPSPLLPLRSDQEKVLQEMNAICVEPTDRSCIGVFGHIYTGFGKSPTASVFAAQKKGPILIFCDRDSVRQGWIGTWKEFFNMDVHAATGDTLGRHDVCICSIQLASLHLDTYKQDFGHYCTVICDEADNLCTQNAVNVLLELAPRYLLGLSATVRRADGLDSVLDIFWGPRKKWIQRLKEFGETCSMTLNILYTSFHVESTFNRKGNLDWTAMAQVVSGIHERNLLIRNLCILHSKSKILILVKTKDHVSTLASMLREASVDVSTYFDRDSSYYDAHVLLATLSKAGRGYDDKQVSSAYDGRRFDILILGMTMKNADQPLGRALRGDKLQVYLLVDDNSTMKKHADEMKKTNSRRGAVICEEYI